MALPVKRARSHVAGCCDIDFEADSETFKVMESMLEEMDAVNETNVRRLADKRSEVPATGDTACAEEFEETNEANLVSEERDEETVAVEGEQHNFDFNRQSFALPRYTLTMLDGQKCEDVSNRGTSRHINLSRENEFHTTNVKCSTRTGRGDIIVNGDMEERHRVLLPNQQKKLLRYNPPWPICEYDEESKRKQHELKRKEADGNETVENKPCIGNLELKTRFAFLASRASRRYASIDEALSELNGWSSHPEIAVDGSNGCGKSTLARTMNRAYLKINELLPRVTDGYGYNLSVFQSLEYMMFQQSVTARNVCWDRCKYSNLAFYYAHLLMYRFRATGVPNDRDTVFEALNSFATATNLAYTVSCMEREKPVPTLFLVCRDLELVALALQRRGTATDLCNAKERDYQLAQYFTYCYFGALLSYPVFDLSDMISETFTLGDLQQAIRDRIDVTDSVSSRDECLLSVPDTASANRLASFLARVDDVLLYDRSLK